MKKMTISGVLAVALLFLAGSGPLMAADFTFVDTGYYSAGGPDTKVAINASATASSGMLAFSDSVDNHTKIYDIATGTVTDIGIPQEVENQGTYLTMGAITDDGYVAAYQAGSYGKMWFYDDHTGSWAWHNGNPGWTGISIRGTTQTQAIGNDGALRWYNYADGTVSYDFPAHDPDGISWSGNNDSGDVVAPAAPWGTGSYLWDSTTQTWDSTVLPIDGLAINDSRIIAGANRLIDAGTGGYQPILYDYNTGVTTPIPFIPAGGYFDFGQPMAINDSNAVVGWMGNVAGGSKYPFIYDPVNGSRALYDEAVVENYPDVGPRSVDIINDNMVMAGITHYHVVFLIVPIVTHNPGDVTGDKFVGGADLTKIIDNWGMSPANWGDGDIDPFDAGDDFIGGADYTQVLNNWGTSYGPEPVPEPAAMTVMLLGGLALLGWKK